MNALSLHCWQDMILLNENTDKRTLGYPPVVVRLVGGEATSHSRLVRNGLLPLPEPNFN